MRYNIYLTIHVHNHWQIVTITSNQITTIWATLGHSKWDHSYPSTTRPFQRPPLIMTIIDLNILNNSNLLAYVIDNRLKCLYVYCTLIIVVNVVSMSFIFNVFMSIVHVNLACGYNYIHCGINMIHSTITMPL